MSNIEKLALGTVQFGLAYGVSNKSGKVHLDEVSRILDFAKKNGIKVLDTAIAYGESEQTLGEIGVSEWKVISKLPPIPVEVSNIEDWIFKSIDESLKRLKIPKLHGFLLHNSEQILNANLGDKVYKSLWELKNQGIIENIGISIYSPEILEPLISRYEWNIVQGPFNVIDRRLSSSGWLNLLTDKNIEVHIRSVFLQGLLLMSEGEIPDKFSRWNHIWKEWISFQEDKKLSAMQSCLGFIKSFPKIKQIIIGVDSKKHLEEIIENFENLQNLEFPDSLACTDLELIHPSNWSSL